MRAALSGRIALGPRVSGGGLCVGGGDEGAGVCRTALGRPGSGVMRGLGRISALRVVAPKKC